MTVLKATTDPSAVRRTGRSVRETVATLTGTAGGADGFRTGAAAGVLDVRTRTTPSSAATTNVVVVLGLSLMRADILL